MSFNRALFSQLIDDTLKYYDPELASLSARNLLLGVAAVESDFGTYVRQLGGPAISVFMIEPATFNWLRDKYRDRYPIADWEVDDLAKDHWKAALIARLRFRVVPDPLPKAHDVEGLARYWKSHYNTELGAGTVDQFIQKYNLYVLTPQA